MFYNFTNEDFQVKWGGFPYLFKAGKVYDGVAVSTDNEHSVHLSEQVCRVFAHHLATKVLNAPSLDINFIINDKGEPVPTEAKQRTMVNFSSQEALIERALNAPEINVAIPSNIKDLPLIKEEVKPVVVEEKPKAKAKKDEEKFEGIDA